MLTVAKVIQMVQTTKGASPTATETQTLPPFSESLLKFKTTSDASFECAPGTHAASCRELSTLSLAGRAGRQAGRLADNPRTRSTTKLCPGKSRKTAQRRQLLRWAGENA